MPGQILMGPPDTTLLKSRRSGRMPNRSDRQRLWWLLIIGGVAALLAVVWGSNGRGEIDVSTERERQLLKRLAAEGKATRLLDEELGTAKALEADGLLFLVGLTGVVTPKGRRLLAGEEQPRKPDKKAPFGFLE
jgi:hypothetical protein